MNIRSDQLKKEVGYSDDDYDGIFFIRFSDFEKYFKDFQVCYYHDDYKLCSFPYETSRNEDINFRFEIKEPGVYYFSLNQINKRFFPTSDRYSYSKCSLDVFRKDFHDGSWHWIGNCSNADKEYWFKAECLPGIYYAKILTDWKSFVNKICFTTYGPKEVQCEHIDEDTIKSEWIADALANCALSSDVDDWRTYEQQGHKDISYKFE